MILRWVVLHLPAEGTFIVGMKRALLLCLNVTVSVTSCQRWNLWVWVGMVLSLNEMFELMIKGIEMNSNSRLTCKHQERLCTDLCQSNAQLVHIRN